MKSYKIDIVTNKNLDKAYIFFSNSIRDYFPYYTNKSKEYLLGIKYSKDKIAKALEGGFALTAKVNDEIVGLLLVTSKPSAGLWDLSWIMVDEKYRSNGIGSELISVWEKEALSKGVHCLTLKTGNEENSEFYENRGFIKYGILPKGTYGHKKHMFYKLIQEPKEKNYLRF